MPDHPAGAGQDGIRAAIGAAAARFAFSATPRLDAELLMAHAMGIERSALLLGHDGPVPAGFAALVDRRAGQEPIAYITGSRGFWTLDLAVGPGALVPRADSETLIEAALARFAAAAPATILDLGTGPGTLLFALLDEWRDARGIGVDRSAAALGWARRNAAPFGTRAAFVQGDWATAVTGSFDLVVCNPPYIGLDEALSPEVVEYEPGEALFAGVDGLADYRRLAPVLRRLVAPGGAAIVEIGWTQADAVGDLLRAQGFAVDLRRDLGGRPRVLIAA
ncbi:peptide chain release factor N(5)-glutamine methyltransferase [Sphingomonas sp. CFBP 8760]|uniref:peptide chain release factor N(5)-glutamine methyltransferase n=1 Tax=Sphingomonas sp. CFBP 8760 TaxID=2775282 RepID=UPI0017825E7F|nr:peptide chain release factor N(5)-glutamine methyltransferase [Sphingomonas sp. CFBP 8760]MBD8547480.1 peptide chain release factor N(5)-glutamine methyltransferase [Sphingomonas sp. CFBP 8760]